MKSVHDVIISPVITERSMSEASDKKYTFKVAPDANKIEIRRAVEEIFGVEVESVNTMNVRGKIKRVGVHTGPRPAAKKAVVSLTRKSKSIEFFEGMV
ncbi:MAG: 50S ribosomal protein L23 [Oscillospiraceae bacterium]|jgi:large subunit ribosomal protein L23|nr:50S ribosomal protein L23 [Oscillospiraceae bacterium]